MNEITRVGIDLAKRVIQVHAVNTAGRVIAAKALARDKFMAWCAQLPPGCVVAMEACSGAHHWARRLQALGLDAQLIAAHFVTPIALRERSGWQKAVVALANKNARILWAMMMRSDRFDPNHLSVKPTGP